MSDMKPREFWIETYITSHAIKPVNTDRYTRVVHFDDYHKLEIELESYKRYLHNCDTEYAASLKERDKLKSQLAICKEVLGKLKHTYDIDLVKDTLARLESK